MVSPHLPVGRARDRPPRHVVERQTGLFLPIDAHPQPRPTLHPAGPYVGGHPQTLASVLIRANHWVRVPKPLASSPIDLTLPLALPACF